MALYKHGQLLTQVADPAFDQKHHPGTGAVPRYLPLYGVRR